MPESVYRQRNPQSSPYYRCVEDHFEMFEMVYEDRFERQYDYFRPYVKRVIYRYLDCSVLKNGFARVRCGDCGHESGMLNENRLRVPMPRQRPYTTRLFSSDSPPKATS